MISSSLTQLALVLVLTIASAAASSAAAAACSLLSLQGAAAFSFVPISRTGLSVYTDGCMARRGYGCSRSSSSSSSSRSPLGKLFPTTNTNANANTNANTNTFSLYSSNIRTKEQQEQSNATASDPQESSDRFDRVAPSEIAITELCIITIYGVRHNMTDWANAHPGGRSVLMKYHGRDATKAFEAAGHSRFAFNMLKKFAIQEPEPSPPPPPPSIESESESNAEFASADGSSDRDSHGDRFDRVAPSTIAIAEPCIVTINGVRHNMTAWANAHPGGRSALMKFHGRDATKAFAAAGHSPRAIAMLEKFAIRDDKDGDKDGDKETAVAVAAESSSGSGSGDLTGFPAALAPSGGILTRIRSKLFTSEDPIGIHKYCGIFSLLHFAYRYVRCVFGDPAAGFGRGSGIASIACILPHATLSLSSLIFHTVPKERVVGLPMIWQEYRAHNIIFGMRSILCTFLAWLAIWKPVLRRACVLGSSLCVMAALRGADWATENLRSDATESTTATMPYWEGCSTETQKRFKKFYAYAQFGATLGCLDTTNPLFPFIILFPIQFASLLMTLVRKGLLSAKSYHILYTASLFLPFVPALRPFLASGSGRLPIVLAIGFSMFQLRRMGVSKYVLWGSAALARNTIGYNLWTY